jgi:hypothetical protein
MHRMNPFCQMTTDPGSHQESQPALIIGDEQRTDTTSGYVKREKTSPKKEIEISRHQSLSTWNM